MAGVVLRGASGTRLSWGLDGLNRMVAGNVLSRVYTCRYSLPCVAMRLVYQQGGH